MSDLYSYTVQKPSGTDVLLEEYKGKVLLVVNTASKCGLTPQFAELQELYEKYQDQGLLILGFPCNQFNNQEFDNIEETTEFCQVNYGVTFPMFARIDVNGANEHPLFTYLKEQQPGMLMKNIKWNFTKFLVDRDGNVVERFAPTTTPSAIEEKITELL